MPGLRGADRWIELALATVIAGATVVNACVANRQWSAIAKNNEIITRPYVKIDLKPETFSTERQNPNTPGRYLSIQFSIENTGRLPALTNVQVGLVWETRNRQRPHKPSSSSGVGRRFLFPQQDSGLFTAYSDSPLTDG